VKIELDGDGPGWLVLTDMWFPGWTCTVDGEECPIYPGDYLFRTVPVPAGRHEIAFRFLPKSYVLGWRITLAMLIVYPGYGLLCMLRRLRLTKSERTPISQADQVAAAA
jgi:uncharacterized membrane protein YfhO